MAMMSKAAVLLFLFLAGTASADIFVLRGPNGQLHLTNRGQKSGYKVISRYREFQGSSGMGIHSLRDSNAYDVTLQDVATRFALPPALVKAVIRAESAFNPRATSIKGAMGLMQLMPDTARMHRVRDAYDPVDNIHGGVRHLRYLVDRYAGEIDLVLAAYNAGTRPVDRVRGIPNYAETREYVRRVKIFYDQYREAFASKPQQTAKAPAPCDALAKLEIDKRKPEDLYGQPLVLVNFEGPPMTVPPKAAALFTPAPPL